MSRIMDAMPSAPDVFKQLVDNLDDMDRDHHGPMLNKHQELGRERSMKRSWLLFKQSVQEAISEL